MTKTINTISAERHKARHYAVQALYRWHMNEQSSTDIEAEFRIDYDFAHVDLEYFQALLHGVVKTYAALDAYLEPLLDRKLDDLDAVELAILRMGLFELKERLDVPFKVVINESVSLTRKFGATDGHKYINGVLDKAARGLRTVELGL
ncbi:MAG: transcription antitermination factor NusB [Gammaproteobacteria bacterium]|nr:transcription antitermination factor NusB [Gammaproteobacteria bacterium]